MNRVISVLLLSLLVPGCATVKAHQRSQLMSPVMALSDDPLEAASFEHMWRIREGMVGASGVGGASCGCG